MNDIKETRKTNTSDQSPSSNASPAVIDITGEVENGGSTSKSYACNECQFVSSLESQLKQHKKDKHSKNNGKSSKSNKRSVRIPCDACDFTAESADSYMDHVVMHERNIVSCKECGYKESLKEYEIKQHTKHKFLCNICGHSAVNNDLLKEHIDKQHRSNRQNHVSPSEHFEKEIKS